MTENSPQSPQGEEGSAPRMSKTRKLGLGAALIAVPLGTIALVQYVKNSSDEKDRKAEEGTRFDLKALRHIDPSLIKFHLNGQIHTGMRSPCAMAVDQQGTIWVAGDQLVRSFAPGGQQQKDIPLSETPYCLATSSDGRIFVGFKTHVAIFSSNGQKISEWAPVNGAYLTGIAVWGEDVYVADSGHRIVMRYTMDGQIKAEIGKADPSRGIPGLVAPSPHIQVAVGESGQVWVSNPGRHRMEEYSRDGNLERYWGSAGSGIEQFLGCCNPSNFAMLSDGRIVTAEKGVPRVKVYLADGRMESVVVGPEAFGDNQMGLNLAVDCHDNVLVVEPGTQVVRIYSRINT